MVSYEQIYFRHSKCIILHVFGSKYDQLWAAVAQELEGVIHDIEGHEGQWFAPVAHVPNKINPKLPLQAVLAMYE